MLFLLYTYIKSSVFSCGICDAQISRLVQLQSASESPTSTIIMIFPFIVLYVDLSYEKLVLLDKIQTIPNPTDE